jgi:hypothetical protein
MIILAVGPSALVQLMRDHAPAEASAHLAPAEVGDGEDERDQPAPEPER